MLKELFAEHGIPECLCSDNGPQFASVLSAKIVMSEALHAIQVHPQTHEVMDQLKQQ